MTFFFAMRMVLRALSHHKGRSFLTILGIVIGIVGIITITAIGRGAQKKARDSILAFGSKSVGIWSGNPEAKGVSKPPKPLKKEDVDAIRAQCPLIKHITPMVEQHASTLEYDGICNVAQIIGARENIFAINEYDIGSGIFFTKQHDERNDCVAVIDEYTRSVLFKWDDPLGKVIRLDTIPFTIIGVQAPLKLKSRWERNQLKVYIPFSVAYTYYMKDPRQLGIGFSTYREQDTAEATRQVIRILRAAHHLQDDEPNDFMTFDAQTMAEVAEAGAMIIAMFALIAAAIALLVGGIGVMNIMLVAVKERTKEIGIKMALGAPQKLILRQFLYESVILCALGGLIGIGLGVGLAESLARLTELPAIVEWQPIFISFFITVLVGIFFGFYPAYKASRLNPVEALVDQ